MLGDFSAQFPPRMDATDRALESDWRTSADRAVRGVTLPLCRCLDSSLEGLRCRLLTIVSAPVV